MNTVNAFENSKLVTIFNKLELDYFDYEPHKIFKGVFIKHLIKGNLTNNKISCHLVKVCPNCVLSNR